jgi:hypothetical protein
LRPAADFDFEPSMEIAGQIGSDAAGSNLAPVGMRPPKETPGKCVATDETVTDQPIDVQLQTVLQANALVRSRHCKYQF